VFDRLLLWGIWGKPALLSSNADAFFGYAQRAARCTNVLTFLNLLFSFGYVQRNQINDTAS